MSGLIRFCCKSLFALVIKNFPGFRRDFRVKMWGTSALDVKLADDLGNTIESTRIRGRRSDFLKQENQGRAIWDFYNNIISKRTQIQLSDASRVAAASCYPRTQHACSMASSARSLILKAIDCMQNKSGACGVRKLRGLRVESQQGRGRWVEGRLRTPGCDIRFRMSTIGANLLPSASCRQLPANRRIDG